MQSLFSQAISEMVTTQYCNTEHIQAISIAHCICTVQNCAFNYIIITSWLSTISTQLAIAKGGTGRTHYLEAVVITSRQIWGHGVIKCGHVVNKDTINVVENDTNSGGGGWGRMERSYGKVSS